MGWAWTPKLFNITDRSRGIRLPLKSPRPVPPTPHCYPPPHPEPPSLSFWHWMDPPPSLVSLCFPPCSVHATTVASLYSLNTPGSFLSQGLAPTALYASSAVLLALPMTASYSSVTVASSVRRARLATQFKVKPLPQTLILFPWLFPSTSSY